MKKAQDKESTSMYQCIFYLAPGDYHRYHSPTEMLVKKRNHILGYLRPVKLDYISKNKDVYETNERVAIFGEWKYGLMSMVFVGATNVGSIVLNFDKELKTNRFKLSSTGTHIVSYSKEGEDAQSPLPKSPQSKK
jgi:phosphatidylserine decarboxylase